MEKDALVVHCRKLLERKLTDIRNELEQLQLDLTSESKSTAGDKHETGRAMIHLEVEKLAVRMQEAELMLQQWDKIDFIKQSSVVQPGTLVQTNQGLFLISVPYGRVEFSDESLYLISPGSPLGKQLEKKAVHALFEINARKYSIVKIY